MPHKLCDAFIMVSAFFRHHLPESRFSGFLIDILLEVFCISNTSIKIVLI